MQANRDTTKPILSEQSDASDKCTFVVIPPKYIALKLFNYRKVIPTDLVTQKVLEQDLKEKDVWNGIDVESTGHTGNKIIII